MHHDDAEVTTAMLAILVRYLCRNTKCQMSGGFFALFEKIYHGQPILTVFSNQISGKMYNSVTSVVSNKFMM